MKLVEEYKKLPKELVYDMYLRIVYDCKDYDNISRVKMLNAIIDEYKQTNFLYNMCTGREILLLKKIYGKELKENDIEEYQWEINQLNKKCILSFGRLEVFEELKDIVYDAINRYNKKEKDGFDRFFASLIGFVKVNGEMLEKAFMSFATSFFGYKDKDINNLMGAPIFHFYCGYSDTYVPSLHDYEDTVYYRDYFDMLEDLDEARKEYAVGGSIQIRMDMYQNIFYYDLDISDKKSKELYDTLKNNPQNYIYYLAIGDARVLNDYTAVELFVDDEKLKKLIYEALGNNPCAAMNGCSPNNRIELMKEKEDLKYKYSSVPQNNAHLPKRAADEYYKLYFALLEYTNNKYEIEPKLKRIYKQEELNPKDLSKIDEYLWEHKEIIDDFLKENTYDLNDEEIGIISEFKKAIRDLFIIIKFDREYTEFLDERNGIIYMVKGVRADFDEIMDDSNLPQIVNTTLLPFKGHIIFSSLLSSMDISMGNSVLRVVDDCYDKAVKYYHL